MTFYNVSGNVTAFVTFDDENPGSPVIWGAQNLIVWEEGAPVEVKSKQIFCSIWLDSDIDAYTGQLNTDGPFIELSFRSDGLVAQRQIFKQIHPSASDKEALAKLAGHKSWDAYVTSRKVGG